MPCPVISLSMLRNLFFTFCDVCGPHSTSNPQDANRVIGPLVFLRPQITIFLIGRLKAKRIFCIVGFVTMVNIPEDALVPCISIVYLYFLARETISATLFCS